jgi:hypothetical protein
MDCRKLLGVDGIKGPEQVQFAIVIRRRVAKDRHLNIHVFAQGPVSDLNSLTQTAPAASCNPRVIHE